MQSPYAESYFWEGLGMRRAGQHSFKGETFSKKEWTRPVLGKIKLTDSEFDQIRSAKDPVAALKDFWTARKARER